MQTIAYAVGEEAHVPDETTTECSAAAAVDDRAGDEAAADTVADAAEQHDGGTGTTQPRKETLDVPAFLWLATAAQAQLHALNEMPLDELNADDDGRTRFARMHRRHRKDAREAVPSFVYAQLTSSTPWLPRNRTPSAAELRSAYAGFDAWCQHVYQSLKQQMAAPPQEQPEPAQQASVALVSDGTSSHVGQYL